MTKDEFIEAKEIEWIDGQDYGGCNCPAGNPPCTACVLGYTLPMDEFVELAIDYEFDQENVPTRRYDHEDFDHAMKGVF